jgi:hypothetical protein
MFQQALNLSIGELPIFLQMTWQIVEVGIAAPPAENSQSSHHHHHRTRRLRHTGRRQGQSVGHGEGVQGRNVAGRGGAADALVEVRRQEGEVLAVDEPAGYADQPT